MLRNVVLLVILGLILLGIIFYFSQQGNNTQTGTATATPTSTLPTSPADASPTLSPLLSPTGLTGMPTGESLSPTTTVLPTASP